MCTHICVVLCRHRPCDGLIPHPESYQMSEGCTDTDLISDQNRPHGIMYNICRKISLCNDVFSAA